MQGIIGASLSWVYLCIDHDSGIDGEIMRIIDHHV